MVRLFVFLCQLLDAYDLVDFACNRGFILSTQDDTVGGFAKWMDYHPGRHGASREDLEQSFQGDAWSKFPNNNFDYRRSVRTFSGSICKLFCLIISLPLMMIWGRGSIGKGLGLLPPTLDQLVMTRTQLIAKICLGGKGNIYNIPFKASQIPM